MSNYLDAEKEQLPRMLLEELIPYVQEKGKPSVSSGVAGMSGGEPLQSVTLTRRLGRQSHITVIRPNSQLVKDPTFPSIFLCGRVRRGKNKEPYDFDIFHSKKHGVQVYIVGPSAKSITKYYGLSQRGGLDKYGRYHASYDSLTDPLLRQVINFTQFAKKALQK